MSRKLFLRIFSCIEGDKKVTQKSPLSEKIFHFAKSVPKRKCSNSIIKIHGRNENHGQNEVEVLRGLNVRVGYLH